MIRWGFLLAVLFALAIPLKAADTSLSNLVGGNAISGTDLFYDVQTAGSGGVKVTGTQLKTFMSASPTFTGTVIIPTTASAAQCLQVSSGGIVFGTGSLCSTGSVTTVSNSDGSLTVSPVTGSVIASLSTAHANTWTTGQVFSSGLTGTTAVFTNVTGTVGAFTTSLTSPSATFQTATINSNLTGTTGAFATSLTSPSATFQTLTVNNLTPTGPNCLQETNGVVQANGSACGGGGGTPSTGGPLLPSSQYLGGASGNLAPTFYVPASGIASQGALEGIGLATSATSTLATAVLQFNMPEVVPTGNMWLRLLYMSTATTGNVSTWIQDALTAASASLGAATLTSETTKTIAMTTTDILIEKQFALTQTPTAGNNQILTVLLNLTTNVATTVVIQPSIIWH